MLSVLFSRFVGSLGMALRVFRAFFLRQATGIGARVKRLGSASRYAAKALPKAVSAVVSVGKKPESREDYFETKHMYIAKSLIMAIVLAVIAFSLLAFYVLRPWLVSRYFTARFFRENSVVETYSGKVLLYYDEEKSKLFFKGRLTEGAVAGEGEEYGEDGLLTYSGEWENGVYGGKGRLYTLGELVYEGEFAAGLYGGQGRLYENGALVYEGAFDGGAPNGEGTAYGADGDVIYRGGFADGRYSGAGREYDGGRLLFSGEFAEGEKNGQGTMFLSGGLTLEAVFEDGAPRGAARIYSDGFLVYEGASAEGLPQGFGALYSPQSGRELYRGEFVNGRPDGGAMLGLGASDLSLLFGGTAPEATAGDGFFAYENRAAGFTLYFPKRRSESDPQCARAAIYEPADAGTPWRAMPWGSAGEYEDYLKVSGETPERAERVFTGSLLTLGYGEYYGAEYASEDGARLVTIWSREAGGDALAVIWELAGALDASAEAEDESSEDSDLGARVEDMLTELGLLPPSPGGGADSGEAAEQNPYYGEKSPESLLFGLTAAGLRERIELLTDYHLNAELRVTYESRLKTLRGRMERLKSSAAPSESLLKALETRIRGVELNISACAVEMNRAEERLGTKLGGYDVQSALLILDPSKIDAAELQEAVLSGGAVGFADVKELLLDAELAYQGLLLAQTELGISSEALAAAADSFAVGRLGMAELEDARMAVQEKAAALYSALRELSR
ncbi:MAG: hypothetical protein LBC28_00040, partial [Oscillospiraceae bacterium]|nr:hypothetical protein [Oscillospiraceae bacterium]